MNLKSIYFFILRVNLTTLNQIFFSDDFHLSERRPFSRGLIIILFDFKIILKEMKSFDPIDISPIL